MPQAAERVEAIRRDVIAGQAASSTPRRPPAATCPLLSAPSAVRHVAQELARQRHPGRGSRRASGSPTRRVSVSCSFCSVCRASSAFSIPRPTWAATPSIRRTSDSVNSRPVRHQTRNMRAHRLAPHGGGREQHGVRLDSLQRAAVEARIGVRVGGPGGATGAPHLGQRGTRDRTKRPRQELLEQMLGHVVARQRHERSGAWRRDCRRRPCRRRTRCATSRATARIDALGSTRAARGRARPRAARSSPAGAPAPGCRAARWPATARAVPRWPWPGPPARARRASAAPCSREP